MKANFRILVVHGLAVTSIVLCGATSVRCDGKYDSLTIETRVPKSVNVKEQNSHKTPPNGGHPGEQREIAGASPDDLPDLSQLPANWVD